MSLESALEEERLEILKLLERPTKSPPPVSRSGYGPSSPLGSRTASPNRARVTSMIDLASPPSHLNNKKSPSSSPSLKYATPANNNGLFRSRLDSGGASAPRLLEDIEKAEFAGPVPHGGYNFHMNPSAPSAVPKRVSQAGKSKGPVPSRPIRSMLGDPTDFIDSKGKIKRAGSPATNAAIRAQLRSTSPIAGWTDSARSSSGRLSSPPPENRYSLPPDDTLDLTHAYARLNDEALSKSGGILGKLPEKKPVLDSGGEHIRAGSGESITRDGGVRLRKDYHYNSNAEKAIADSSDDGTSDDGESSGGEEKSDDDDGSARGRRQSRPDGESESDSGATARKPVSSLLNIGLSSSGKSGKKKSGEKKRVAQSLLAAAEEERVSVSSKYKVKSLLPSISVTQPGSGANGPSMISSSKRTGVHPNTNFDVSHASSPMSSEAEADLQDLRRAQRMEMIISPITSTPETHRVVRTIVRGDYDSLLEEIENDQRRQRTYLVATDMSGEAAHALEWTIGTVLRDGDTLLAIYAVDEDSVDSSALTPTTTMDNGLPEGVVMAPTSPRFPLPPPMAALPAHVTPSSPMISFSTPVSRSSTPPPSASRRGSGEKKRGISRDRSSIVDRTKAEVERISAAENITQLVTKLLKKTRLQVRCVVEVIHCKSPKHLLTEMIDYIEPTLVILGSRGRSALKGVLLGSFSNYLVTKSSVPVMVARKKLKQHSKSKKKSSPFAIGVGGSVNVRLTNNLVSSMTGGRAGSGLAMAKVD
ncbi:hypothetical protein DFH27DRAFT_629059 [Peziza echinospora]|nr:hypothetical protein DFH27DRAFT_629059 [Peziza echinospora]